LESISRGRATKLIKGGTIPNKVIQVILIIMESKDIKIECPNINKEEKKAKERRAYIDNDDSTNSSS